jgi:hypothetical protein
MNLNKMFENTSIKTEKDVQWEKLTEEVGQIVDRKRKPIDAEIKDAVIALKAFGLPTDMSCGGHEHGEGATAPWVGIYAPEPPGLRENPGKRAEWKEENEKLQARVSELLNEFYQGKEIDPDAKLDFKFVGIYGGFKITNAGADKLQALSPEEQKIKLSSYRKEMNSFTEFLKAKFFQET